MTSVLHYGSIAIKWETKRSNVQWFNYWKMNRYILYLIDLLSKCGIDIFSFSCWRFFFSSRAVSSVPFTLFFPIIPWLLQLILFAWFVSVLAYPLPFKLNEVLFRSTWKLIYSTSFCQAVTLSPSQGEVGGCMETSALRSKPLSFHAKVQ